ncbi:hypothetical protein KA005_06455, partial [bacterium]|nr:hypothetical protein [bacterium]
MKEPKIRFGLILITVFIAAFLFFPNRQPLPEGGDLLSSHETYEPARIINGSVESGETFFHIFKRHGLDHTD